MNAQSSPVAPTPARGVAPFLAPLQREFDRVLADFNGFDLGEMFGPSPRMDLREVEGGITGPSATRGFRCHPEYVTTSYCYFHAPREQREERG